jgi:hypothetical protein
MLRTDIAQPRRVCMEEDALDPAIAIIVLMAAGFHLRADERLNAVETGLWASIAGVIAIGRWDLVASLARIPPWVRGAKKCMSQDRPH